MELAAAHDGSYPEKVTDIKFAFPQATTVQSFAVTAEGWMLALQDHESGLVCWVETTPAGRSDPHCGK